MPVFLTIITLALQCAAVADNPVDASAPVSILYYESIRLITTPEPDKHSATSVAAPDTRATLSFDAYGRRFELQTDETSAVNGTNFTRWSGRLAGLPGSWFRLLQDGEKLSGIITDGVDTYFIEPRHRVADLLIETPPANAPLNVIYRLADMLVPPGLLSCMTPGDTAHNDEATDARVNGQTAFAKLGAELQAVKSITAASDSPRLLLGIIADESFVDKYADETEDQVAIIFNTVQGLYANELGLELEVDSVFSVTPDIVNPLSATVVAGDLLDELGHWRSANQKHLDHTHLLTRKKLTNDAGDHLAGISFLGQPGRSGVCNPVTGAALSRDTLGLTALIVAHEIGHNLGAPHDGDSEGACALEPEDKFIMSPKIFRVLLETEVKFSGCSITQIDKVIAAASCLTGMAEAIAENPASGGGGGALGWLSVTGLLVSPFLRRRRSVDLYREGSLS